CRHIFYLRKALNMETLIPTQCLMERWLLSTARSYYSVRSRRETPWDVNRKYREAKQVTARICATLSEFGMSEFRVALGVLRRLDMIMKNGKMDHVERMLSTLSDAASSVDGSLSEYVQSDPVTSPARTIPSPPVPARTIPPPPVSPPHNRPASHPSPPPESVVFGDNEDYSSENGDATFQRTSDQPVDSQNEQQSELESIVQPLIPSTVNSNQQTNSRTINFSAGPHISFEVENPIKSRGRPRQKPKNLSLQNVHDTLDNSPTFASLQILRQFKTYIFVSRPKNPTAYKLSKVPATKVVWRLDGLTRVLPAGLLRRCQEKPTALQKKHVGLAEKDTALEVHGVGCFDGSTLRVMRSWHDAMSAMKLLDRTVAWIRAIDFGIEVPEDFYIVEDASLSDRVNQIDPLSSDMEICYLAAKGTLGDKVMHTTTASLFGQDPSTLVLDCTLFGIVVNGTSTTDMSKIEAALFKLSREKIVIPFNFNGNRWCSIMVDLAVPEIKYYGPMRSSYTKDARGFAEKLKPLLPVDPGETFRVLPYETGMDVQVDSYNCGVYVLLGFEQFVGKEALGNLSKKKLDYFRYRYLSISV
ncbi:hypothetical protein PHMEG_00032295, partial [Phytophthora megakarya]